MKISALKKEQAPSTPSQDPSDKRVIVYVYACNKLSMPMLRKEKSPKPMCLTLDYWFNHIVLGLNILLSIY